MKFRRNKKDFFEFENDRKTHVKLYKAGKQWVSSLISSIGLIRVFKGRLDKSAINTQLVSKEKDKKSEDKLSSDGITAALKGAAVLGAVAGGATLTTNTALADTKQLDSNQNLATKDTVNLSSGSGSSSVSDSLSTSESNIQSEASVSKSESVSLNTNSSSTSETKSNSNSSSESISESKSNSQSQASTSQSISRSESLASSSSINNSSNVTSSKAEFESMVNQGSAFINSSEFKSADGAYQEAYKTAIQRFQTILSDPQSGLTDSDYAYGVQQLQALQQAIKSKETPQPQVFAANVGEDRGSNGFIEKGQVDMTGTPVYDDFSRWAGYDTSSYGPDKTINVQVTTDPNNPNKKHWVITYLPEGFRYTVDGKNINKATADRMGFALTKDLTIDGQVKFNTYYYENNNDNTMKAFNGKVTPIDQKISDGDYYFKDGQLVSPSGTPISNNIYYDGKTSWNSDWQKAIKNPDFHPDKSLTLGQVDYYNDFQNIHDHFFNSSGTDDSSPKVASWAPTEKEDISNGQGMFVDNLNNIVSVAWPASPSTAGQYNQEDFTQVYTWKTWGEGGNTQSATYVVSFDTISDPTIKENLTYSGIISALGTRYYDKLLTFDNNYGHLTGEEVSQNKEYKHIKVKVTNIYDTKGKNNVSIPENDMTVNYITISSNVHYTADGKDQVATVDNPYSKYNESSRKIVEDMGSRTINDGDSKSYEYTINAIVAKDGIAKAYTDKAKTNPIKDDSGNYVTANFTRDDLAAATHVFFKNPVLEIPSSDGDRVDTYYLDQNNQYNDGVLTVTNKWVRQVKIVSLEDDLYGYKTAIQNFLNYIQSEDFVNPWKYDTETNKITAPSSNIDTTAYQKKLDEVNKWKQRFSDDIKGLDPANYQKYGDQYKSLLDTYDNIASIFESSSGKTGADIRSTLLNGKKTVDFSHMPIKEGVDAEGNPIYGIGQGNNVYRDPIVDLLNPVARNIGSTKSEGTILGDQAKLLDYAKSIEGTSLVTDATKNKQKDFNDALKALDDQLKGVDKLSTMKNYYDLLTSANRLKEAIYYLKPSPAEESESISQSISRSGSESISISRSGSESVSKSQSVSMSTSFSESLSTSSSLSESLSTSTSFSESLSTSSSLSESLSTSSSLSESLSTSSSLSESLSTSSSLSESLSTSSSLSESLSTSSSLSESLSTSSSLSESLSTSSSLSESLSTSSSLSESLSTSSSLSESLSTSSSLSESLSTSSSLSESLSTSSSLSESLSTSSSLSESLSTSSSLSESLSTSSSLSESLSTSSSLSESLSTSSSLSESLSTSSSLSESLSTSSSLSESLSTSSSLSESLSTSSSLSESLSTSSSLSESLSTSSSLSESLSTSSSLSESLSTSSSLSESLSTSSSLSESLSTSSSLSESLSTSSSLSESLSTSSSLSESLSTSSSLSESLSTSSSLSESLSTSSSLSESLSTSSSLSESLSTSSSLSESLSTSSSLSESLSTSSSLSESLSTSSSLSESLSTSSSLSESLSTSSSLSESLSTSSSLSESLSTSSSLSESLSTSSSLSESLSTSSSLSESLSTSSSLSESLSTSSSL
ncbi:accessory Sec-dependent serine-rich glycoprotein adhesin, partial [Ligilactobacillus salivarius]|uniref:accessory Sec-dependent serine-rich glycoprotein adhesin n=5 Tax=Ligilactobacillus salivarius TaxID=1624 RepID=UPI00191E459B